MNYEFIARTPKQLDICLRLLYAENIRFMVEVQETNNHKIIYAVKALTEAQRISELKETYRILIS